jgi:hypothetical protein
MFPNTQKLNPKKGWTQNRPPGKKIKKTKIENQKIKKSKNQKIKK